MGLHGLTTYMGLFQPGSIGGDIIIKYLGGMIFVHESFVAIKPREGLTEIKRGG